MALATAIVSLLGAIIGFLIWNAQRQAAPENEHAAMLRDLRAAIVDAELNGRLAAADALRQRLRLLTDGVRDPDGGGQRLAGPTPGGDKNNSADDSGGGPAAGGGG